VSKENVASTLFMESVHLRYRIDACCHSERKKQKNLSTGLRAYASDEVSVDIVPRRLLSGNNVYRSVSPAYPTRLRHFEWNLH